jgi:uncharacterized protein (DUF697 family)
MGIPARYLLFHGSIVLLVGLLCGMPYGIAITRKHGDEVIRAWKLAHGSLSLGGTTMMAMAAILSFLKVSGVIQWLLAAALITSGYGFCFALTLESFVGDRGLSWTGAWSNKVVLLVMLSVL